MRYFIIVTLLILSTPTYSQDLIVTNKGDSIHCKISKVRTDYIYFTFDHKDEFRNTLLPVSNVSSHQFNYYSGNDIPMDSIVGHKNYPQVRLTINGGYSYQTAKLSDNLNPILANYIQGLKSGYHFGGDIIYYLSEPIGVGLKYCSFRASNSDNVYIDHVNEGRIFGEMNDDLNISFIGPTLSTRLFSHQKSNALLLNFSLGYMGYYDKKVFIKEYEMVGNTVGYSFEIGYDIGLSSFISLGFQFSMISGILFEYDWIDGSNVTTIELEQGEYESLNRIDLSIGLRFSK